MGQDFSQLTGVPCNRLLYLQLKQERQDLVHTLV